MSPTFGAFVLCALIWLSPVIAKAEYEVTMDMQMVALPIAEGLKLVPHVQNEATQVDARDRLQKMLSQGKAELLGWPVIRAVNNPRAVSASDLEIRSPADSNSLYSHMAVYSKPDASLLDPAIIQGPPAPVRKWIRKVYDTRSNMPSNFEVDTSGALLEAECRVYAPSNWIDANLVARFRQDDRYPSSPPARQLEWMGTPYARKEFSIAGFVGGIYVRNGGHVLCHTTLLQEPTPRLVLFILHATAVAQPSRTL